MTDRQDSAAVSVPPAIIEIRAMRAGDLDRVAHLEGELFGRSAWSYAMLAEELGGPGRWYRVATARRPDDIGPDRVVGYCGLWFDGDVVQIMTIAVARAHQHRGVGASLLRAMIERARELGAQAVLLEVAVDNPRAIALYARHGFVQIATRKRYYQPEDVDAAVMRRELQPLDQAGQPSQEEPPA